MLPKIFKMPKITKVYTINQKGDNFCPKEKTFIEKLSDYDSPLCDILRFVRNNGSTHDYEIYNHFSSAYKDRQIENALITARYMNLVDVRRRISFL